MPASVPFTAGNGGALRRGVPSTPVAVAVDVGDNGVRGVDGMSDG